MRNNRVWHFCLGLFAMLILGCVSTQSKNATGDETPVLVAPAQTNPNAEPVPPASPFYVGGGGQGISLAILTPKATGLAENQNYIPALVQGEFVSNFSGYSALSVMDRENLDDIYGELLSGYYDDSDEAGSDLGHLTSTDYLMNGSITKTATGYALQMKITKTADKMTAASYSGNCTFAELDNLMGIRRASLDLLQKMGVELTDRTKMELSGAAAENHVNAQTALAQGITAQKGGTVVEALSYYYQAATFDSSLLEAASRANVISTAISSGNIGENVRNDIQRRKEWLALLEEAENYFKDHLPWEIVYNPALTQGKVDYNRETVELSFNIEVRPTDGWKVVQNLIDGLEATGKRDEWGLTRWPLTSRVFFDYKAGRGADSGKITKVTCALLNEKGELIVSETINCINKTEFPFAGYTTEYDIPEKGYRSGITIIRNDIISTAAVSEMVVFKNVNANDITDNLTVKIVSVNDISAEEAGRTGYIRISAAK